MVAPAPALRSDLRNQLRNSIAPLYLRHHKGPDAVGREHIAQTWGWQPRAVVSRGLAGRSRHPLHQTMARIKYAPLPGSNDEHLDRGEHAEIRTGLRGVSSPRPPRHSSAPPFICRHNTSAKCRGLPLSDDTMRRVRRKNVDRPRIIVRRREAP